MIPQQEERTFNKMRLAAADLRSANLSTYIAAMDVIMSSAVDADCAVMEGGEASNWDYYFRRSVRNFLKFGSGNREMVEFFGNFDLDSCK